MTKRIIEVKALARVEGEGALKVVIEKGAIKDVALRIYEPPRFFEAFLRGRSFLEVPDITARICGICPVAYMMSSCRALEDALGLAIDPEVRLLRRLLYCGEWIESHALHVFLLHAPDFLGHDDAVSLAKERPDLVKSGLAIKKAGNAIVETLGGRAIHPVNVKVGGFYRAPPRQELRAALDEPIARGRQLARAALRELAKLPFPEVERDVLLVALRHPSEYPMNEGSVATSDGLEVGVREFERHMVEEQVERSNALHALWHGKPYLTGPLARFALNFDRLPDGVKEAAREAGLSAPCRNPFRSILVRAVEILYAFEEAARILELYQPPSRSFVEVPTRESVGFGATEAPRGLLFHRYALDSAGLVREARIVPPTSQNQRSIEDDVRALGRRLVDLPRPDATRLAEQAVRNHDPCISCATHFLTLEVEERS
jgi:coenzyme F420-reducing hydrogenase alpha subunit